MTNENPVRSGMPFSGNRLIDLIHDRGIIAGTIPFG
jgi:hypothetical protein